MDVPVTPNGFFDHLDGVPHTLPAMLIPLIH